MLVSYRYAHAGKVCSGDYAGFVYTKDRRYVADPQYDEYYLKSEGKFFYVYSILCFSIVAVALCLLLSCGLCMFIGGASHSYENIEDFFKKMDSIPEMMKK